MKKKIVFLLVVLCLVFTGCEKNNVAKELEKKYGDLKGYTLSGTLEIFNNDDVYNYDVNVIYQKKDNFNVSLLNKANNHEQIILKNDDGVYVKTQESTKQKLNVI